MAALADRKFVERILDDIHQEKRLYYKRLDELGLTYVKSHTNFILIDTGRDAAQISRQILKKGIIIKPCTGFGLPTCIRVTIGKHEENLHFLDTFKELIT